MSRQTSQSADSGRAALFTSATRRGGLAAAGGLLVFALLVPVGGTGAIGALEIPGGSAVRAVALVLLAVAGIEAVRRVRDSGSARIREIDVEQGLLLLGAIGLIVSAKDAHSLHEFATMAASVTGQPVLYAAALFVFCRVFEEEGGNLERSLAIWGFAITAEALVVLWQLGSGRAHDPIRGITRAGGTVGADFAGAIAVISLFALVGLYAMSSCRSSRIVASVGVVASIFILIAAVSRGPLVSAGLGLVYLFFTRQHAHAHAHINWRRSLPLLFALCLVLGLGAFLGRGLWQARLTGGDTRQFDRPATWVSGLRIGSDHLVTGVGHGRVFQAVQENQRYQFTPFGKTYANPHNTWIFAFAESGIVYALAMLFATISMIVVVYTAPRSPPVARHLRAGLIAVFPLFFINNLFTHLEVMILVLFSIAALSRAERSTPLSIRKGAVSSQSTTPAKPLASSGSDRAEDPSETVLAAGAPPNWQYSSDLARWITISVAFLALAVVASVAIVRFTDSGTVVRVGNGGNAVTVTENASETSQVRAAASVLARQNSFAQVVLLRQLDHELWLVGLNWGGKKQVNANACYIIDTSRFSTNVKSITAGVGSSLCTYPPPTK